MEHHLTAMECHLPHGITQCYCYLLPDTSEHSVHLCRVAGNSNTEHTPLKLEHVASLISKHTVDIVATAKYLITAAALYFLRQLGLTCCMIAYAEWSKK